MRSFLCESYCLLTRTIKTMNEVSTVDWISRTTNIPVPRVIAYQSSRENPIGFEWITMTRMPGRPLKELWRSLSFSAKTSLVGESAAYSTCLFQNQLQGIGNLYEIASDNSPLFEKEHLRKGLPDMGRIVSMHFFSGSKSFRMFIEGHLNLAVTGSHHAFLLVRKTISRR